MTDLLAAALPYIQLVLSLLLIAAILLQQTTAGLGGAFGGGSDDGTHHTRRGAEITLFRATIVLGVLLPLAAFVALFIS